MIVNRFTDWAISQSINITVISKCNSCILTLQAGIDNDNLTIALEPEAASLFCRHLSVEKKATTTKTSIAKFTTGTNYLVLDAGGMALLVCC